jgi:thiamine biosynthesis lipoprotein
MLIVFSGCVPDALQRYAQTRLVMNAPLQVTVYAPSPPSWDDIFTRADEIAFLYDHRLKQSPMARLNRTGRARVPEPAFTTIKQALRLAEETGGAYDPTVLTLMNLWDFDGQGRLPAREEIDRALDKTGYGHIQVTEPDTVRLSGGAAMDIGGIGEGAVVDAIADYLDSLEYTAYLVDAAGEITVRGAKPDGRPWTVAVRSPRKPGVARTDPGFKETPPGLLGMIEFAPAAGRLSVSTSGDYEKFFVDHGVAYHHILDPRTGYPARGAVSVTVIAPSCAQADSLATSAFVLGYDKGAAFLESQPGVSGLLVREQNGALEQKTTTGFPKLLPVPE